MGPSDPLNYAATIVPLRQCFLERVQTNVVEEGWTNWLMTDQGFKLVTGVDVPRGTKPNVMRLSGRNEHVHRVLEGVPGTWKMHQSYTTRIVHQVKLGVEFLNTVDRYKRYLFERMTKDHRDGRIKTET